MSLFEKTSKKVVGFVGKATEKTKEIVEKTERMFVEKPYPIQPIDFLECDPVFSDGELDYVLFKTREEDEKKVKIMRLFRVKSTSNQLNVLAPDKKESLNEVDFKSILNRFGNQDVSFVSLFASKPGKDVVISYGVIMEGREVGKDRFVEKTHYYINSLIDNFRSSEAYRNIEIIPLTDNEEWIFTEALPGFKKLSLARGIPKPDTATGIQVGTNLYGRTVQAGSQLTNAFLRGATAKVVNGKASGIPFVMCAILNPVAKEEVNRVLFKTEELLGRFKSAKEMNLTESESMSLPFLFGLGMGNSTGVSEQQGIGATESEGISQGRTDTNTNGNGVALQETNSLGLSSGITQGVGLNQMLGESAGSNGGISYVGNYTENTAGSFQEGMSKNYGETETTTNQNSMGVTKSIQESNAVAQSETNTKMNAMSTQETKGMTESDSKSINLAGGMSAGDGSSASRRIINEFFDTGIGIYEKYKNRTEVALRSGMYDMMMFVLTPDEESKIHADQLIKRAYITDGAPMPIRVEEFDVEDEQKMLKYVKSFTKPKVKEYRALVPDAHRYSTYITAFEATAFSLPQINLEGYTMSFDPIPASIQLVGEMEEGACLGHQIHPHFNVLSDHKFQLALEKLTHVGIYGITGVGKTVFTQRFIAEIYNKFDINVMLFDWTRNHRSLLGHLKNPEKFKFNSFKTNLFPFRFNPLRVPKGVPEHIWVPAVAELFCYLMGLGSRSFQIIIDVLEDLLEAAKKNNREATMKDLVKAVDREFERRQAETGGKMDFNEISTFRSMKDRLKRWLKTGHPVFECLCSGNFINVEDMVRGDFVHLIECNELPEELKQFIINTVAAGIFYHSKFYKKLAKPVYMIFEEAHAVLGNNNTNDALQPSETIFEIINREARNYNLFVGYICQSPELLPEKIFDCTPLRFVFQLPDSGGKDKIISAGGRDPIRIDVDLVKWLSRQPRGTCLVRGSIFDKIQDNEFVALHVDMLPTDDLEDEYFDKLYRKKTNNYVF